MTKEIENFLSDLPTRREEGWKYTDLKAIGAVAEGAGWTSAPAARAQRLSETGPLAEIDADTLVFVDGNPVVSDETSDIISVMPEGIEIAPRPGRPLHLAFVSTAIDGEAFASSPKLSLAAKAGQHYALIESHTAIGTGNTLCMPRISIEAPRDAVIKHAALFDESAAGFTLSRIDVTLDQGAEYDGFALQTGLGLTRREATVTLAGEHGFARLGGAYVGRDSSHIDNTTLVVHNAANARSLQDFRGVLDGESRGVFQGKVLVAKDAQGTDGQQQHKALLLSPKAEVDAKPELEIYADDVQCAHGATVGAIDQNQLFYLRARGIPEDHARAMLTEAFLMQSLSGISDMAIRDVFRAHLTTRLGDR